MKVSSHNFTRRAWPLACWLWFVELLKNLDRMILGTMRPPIKEGIPMTDARFGLLATSFLAAWGRRGTADDEFNAPHLIMAGRECGVNGNCCWLGFESRETEDLLFPNGPYAKHVEKRRSWNYKLDCGMIRDSWNDIVVSNESTGEESAVGVMLAIKGKHLQAAA